MSENGQTEGERQALALALLERMPGMPEAPVLAWTMFQKGPGKPTWTVSIRGGLPPDVADYALRVTLEQVAKFEEYLEVNGYSAVYNGRSQMATPRPAQSAKQPAPPSVSPPGTPPAPQVKPSPQGNGLETFKVEYISVDSITAAITESGKRNYKVRGGRVKKHGVTCWPEIAEPQLLELLEYDVKNLEVGQPWDVSGFNIQAVAIVPEGKQFPNKVTGFTPVT